VLIIKGKPHACVLADDGPARIREAYPGETRDRLRATKRQDDPISMFRLNQNVPPAASDS